MITSFEYRALLLTKEIIELERKVSHLEEICAAEGCEPEIDEYVSFDLDGRPQLSEAGVAAMKEYEESQGPS